MAGWPVADPALLVQDTVTCVVQVAGKVRDRLEVPPDISEDDLRALALAAPGVARTLAGGRPQGHRRPAAAGEHRPRLTVQLARWRSSGRVSQNGYEASL